MRDPAGNRIPTTSRLFIWASDPHARLGFNNDPASTTHSTAWLDLGETRIWAWWRGWRPVIRIDRDGKIGSE